MPAKIRALNLTSYLHCTEMEEYYRTLGLYRGNFYHIGFNLASNLQYSLQKYSDIFFYFVCANGK